MEFDHFASLKYHRSTKMRYHCQRQPNEHKNNFEKGENKSNSMLNSSPTQTKSGNR